MASSGEEGGRKEEANKSKSESRTQSQPNSQGRTTPPRDLKRQKRHDNDDDDDDDNNNSNSNPSLIKMHSDQVLPRRCFVTIGATAGFRQLLDEIIQPAFLTCLAEHGFDMLEVQCGPDHDWFAQQTGSLEKEATHGVEIRSFEYTKDMQSHMLECRGEAGVRLAGCIISHAGSGTILEALRYQAPLVVVPNPTLMDNHQAELAEECEQQNWAVYGKLGHLAAAVGRSCERLAQGRSLSHLNALAPYSPPPFPVPERERVTLFDWMVLTCYPDELARQQHLRDLDAVELAFVEEQWQKSETETAGREREDLRSSPLEVD